MPERFTRRHVLSGLAAGGAALAIRPAAAAEGWPTRPVAVVVPQAAGNSPDVLCRMVADQLSRTFGQQFVVENKPGAANIVGTQAVTRAAPDGYTLLFATSASLVANPYTFKKLSYDPIKDLSPIALVAKSNHVLAVHPDVPAKTLAELVALEKAKPGSLSIAVDGPRNLSGLLAQSINRQSGMNLVLVPYNTISAAIQDTLTGRTQVILQSISVLEPHIQERTLRPLAVAGARRIGAMPEVPALAETLPALDMQGWFMLLGPAGVPAEIARALSAALVRILSDKGLRDQAAKLGFEIDPAFATDAAGATAFLRKEYADTGKAIAALGLEPQ